MKLQRFQNVTSLPDKRIKNLLRWTAEQVGVPAQTRVYLSVHDEVPVYVGQSTFQVAKVGPAPYYGDTRLFMNMKGNKRHLVRLAVDAASHWYPVEPPPYYGEPTPKTNTPEENFVALAAHELTHVKQHAEDRNMTNGVSMEHMEQEAVRESHRVLAEFRKQEKVRIPNLEWYSNK